MDIDEVNITDNEFLSEDESINNKRESKQDDIKEFKTRNVDNIDLPMLQEVADFVVTSNKTIKTDEKFLQWRAIAIIPRSNDHALRFILKTFLEYIPRNIKIWKLKMIS